MAGVMRWKNLHVVTNLLDGHRAGLSMMTQNITCCTDGRISEEFEFQKAEFARVPSCQNSRERVQVSRGAFPVTATDAP